jgi:hypothetical protein
VGVHSTFSAAFSTRALAPILVMLNGGKSSAERGGEVGGDPVSELGEPSSGKDGASSG